MHDLSETPEPAADGGSARRKRYGFVAAAVAVVVIAAVPLAWGALNGDDAESDPKPRPESLAGPAGTEPAADFNNDGVQDLYTKGEIGGGPVSVLYGSEKGASDKTGSDKSGPDKDAKDSKKDDATKKDDSAKDESHKPDKDTRKLVRLTLDSPGIPGGEGKGVSFAEHTAARDFDGDGFTDLAVSVETWRAKTKPPEGTKEGLLVLWGSKDGLTDGSYLKGVPKSFLRSPIGDDLLVAGDMDGDGHSDLVIGIGSKKGLIKGPFGRDGSTGGTAAVPHPFPKAEEPELVTAFTADLNGDGSDDLISSHGTEDDGMGSGKVETAWTAGGPDGFAEPDTGLLPGIQSFTTGDVDKDGYTDLVLCRYRKGSSSESAAMGPVEVFHGSADGPDPSRHTQLDQDSPGVPGKKQEFGQFGYLLTAGDADGDGYADVMASLPGEEGHDADDKSPSAVTVLHGSSDGLTGRGADYVEEPASSVEEGRAYTDTDTGTRFADAGRLADTDGDGHTDVVIGAPRTGGWKGAVWNFPAEKGKWPEDLAEVYRPDDFESSTPPPDEDTMGAYVG